MMYKAARARFRLDELTVGTFNVLTEAVNDVYGIGRVDTLSENLYRKGLLSYRTAGDQTGRNVRGCGFRIPPILA